MKLWHETLDYTYISFFKVEIFILSILKSARWKNHTHKYVNVLLLRHNIQVSKTNNKLNSFLMEKNKENEQLNEVKTR